MVKLQLPISMRIHLVVNVSQIVRYMEQMRGQKKKEVKLIEVDGEKEWKVERILNKRKVRDIEKYLVRWKRFTVEHDTWEKEEDLVNAREAVDEFEGRISIEVRRQEGVGKWNPRMKKDKWMELLGRYMAKFLYGWDNGKFEEEYLRKLEKN